MYGLEQKSKELVGGFIDASDHAGNELLSFV